MFYHPPMLQIFKNSTALCESILSPILSSFSGGDNPYLQLVNTDVIVSFQLARANPYSIEHIFLNL